MDEHLLVDKPSAMTSFGVVGRIRRVLSKASGKKVKVGHTGTLDPFATGLMIILTGEACKQASSYSKLDKVYTATFRLGQNSTTGDPEGEISDVSTLKPTIEQIETALDDFRGEIIQSPPIFSAIKINGKRAYDLARRGEIFEMPKRKVNVYRLEIIDYSYPNLKVEAHVSSGTYIRSIAFDLGRKLETGAFCSQLRRIRVGEWRVEDAKKLTFWGIKD